MIHKKIIFYSTLCAPLLFIAVFFWSDIVTFAQSTSTPAQKPNFIIIQVDDLDTETFFESGKNGIFGNFVRNGTYFNNYYVTTSQCCPSRASLLTGQYAHNHGVLNNSAAFDGSYSKLDHKKTLATWLKNGGYTTGMIGKYMNGYGLADTNPNDNLDAKREIPPGWDYWFALYTAAYYNYDANDNGVIKQFGNSQSDYSADVETNKALSFIDAQKTSSKPFFLLLNYSAPHSPFTPAAKYAGTVKGLDGRMPGYNELDMSDKPQYLRNQIRMGVVDPKTGITPAQEIIQQKQLRREAMASVDEAVGNIIAKLTANNQLKNTYLIFVSDNGFMSGEHLIKEGKVVPYQQSVRVPFAIRGPKISSEVTKREMVANIDIAPTVLELAGVTQSDRVIDGVSLVSVLNAKRYTPVRNYIFLEFLKDFEGGALPFYPAYNAIITDNFKYIKYSTSGEEELYDLLEDPYELNSKHNDSDSYYQNIKLRLSTILSQKMNCSGNCNF